MFCWDLHQFLTSMPTPRFPSHPTSRVPHHPHHVHDAGAAATASGLTPRSSAKTCFEFWTLQPTSGIRCCACILISFMISFFDTFSQGTKISPQGVSKDCVGCAVKVLAAESELHHKNGATMCHKEKNGFRKEKQLKLLTSLYHHFYSMYKYIIYTHPLFCACLVRSAETKSEAFTRMRVYFLNLQRKLRLSPHWGA